MGFGDGCAVFKAGNRHRELSLCGFEMLRPSLSFYELWWNKHSWQQNFTNIYKHMISTRFHSFPVFLGMREALHPLFFANAFTDMDVPERLGFPVSWIPEIFIGLLVQHSHHHHHIRLFQEASKWSDWCPPVRRCRCDTKIHQMSAGNGCKPSHTY